MRSTISAALFLSIIGVGSRSAQARPLFCYNPVTGNVTLTNDLGFTLPAILLKSGSTPLGELATGIALTGTALPIPGSILDTGDQPTAIVYLNFPVGMFSIGNVVTPGTPLSDLTLEYYVSLTAPPQRGDFCFPEPSTCSLAMIGLLGLGRGTRAGQRRGGVAIARR